MDIPSGRRFTGKGEKDGVVLYILTLRDELDISLCQGGIQADSRIRRGTEAAAQC